MVVGQDGTLWICTTAGSSQSSPGTFTQVGAGFSDPTTTKGDLIVRGSSTTRLGVGGDNQILTADSSQSLGVRWATATGSGGVAGNITNTGASGSEPGSPAAGDLYLPTDGYYVERYSGSAWVPWGPIYAMTKPPVVSGWTWLNQGTSTATDLSGGGIFLASPAAGGENLHGLYRSLPGSGAWTVTAYLLQRPGFNINAYGLFLRNSSSGNVTVFFQRSNNNYSFWDYTNATTYAGSPAASDANGIVVGPWWRIADDGTGSGTARTYQTSADGQHWFTVATVGHGGYITPDQIGVGCNPGASGGSVAIAFTLLSWSGA